MNPIKVVLQLNNVQPISTNKMYYTFRRKGGKATYKTKSQEYLAYLDTLTKAMTTLIEQEPELIPIFKTFPSMHCPLIEIVVDIPLSNFMTKTGALKAIDSSNFIKTTEDGIFFYLENNIDNSIRDQQTIKISAAKQLSKTDEFRTTITITTAVEYNPNVHSKNVYECIL